nr:hypothetical protein [Tanacetum cinerariifolium]
QKVSDHVNSGLNKIKDASKPSSSNSGYGDGNKDMNAGFTSFSTSVGGGNQLDDEDSDFYDGYEDQVVDLHGALKEYRDFMLSMNDLIVDLPIELRVNQVFSSWMEFGGNTRDLGSFGEERDKITDLHQIHKEVLFIERRDGVTGIKRRRHDLSSDGVRDLAMASGRGRLKKDLESST